jgi:hypothetical protein
MPRAVPISVSTPSATFPAPAAHRTVQVQLSRYETNFLAKLLCQIIIVVLSVLLSFKYPKTSFRPNLFFG